MTHFTNFRQTKKIVHTWVSIKYKVVLWFKKKYVTTTYNKEEMLKFWSLLNNLQNMKFCSTKIFLFIKYLLII